MSALPADTELFQDQERASHTVSQSLKLGSGRLEHTCGLWLEDLQQVPPPFWEPEQGVQGTG